VQRDGDSILEGVGAGNCVDAAIDENPETVIDGCPQQTGATAGDHPVDGGATAPGFDGDIIEARGPQPVALDAGQEGCTDSGRGRNRTGYEDGCHR
jgi:hypothetical protein